jgi:hypothetical protein
VPLEVEPFDDLDDAQPTSVGRLNVSPTFQSVTTVSRSPPSSPSV